MRPVGGKRPMIESAVTLLPQPDSPTSPTVSPASTSNETPADGRHEALVGREARREVSDREQRGHAGAGSG